MPERQVICGCSPQQVAGMQRVAWVVVHVQASYKQIVVETSGTGTGQGQQTGSQHAAEEW